ncbi:MFS transporter [Brevundimonas sp.]|uniref:MFS transporter n=1 Tax=Brevundimonas sp. TaxID=1871086 RepID=UPI003D0F0513
MARGLLGFFATGPDLPEMVDRSLIDTLYRRYRLRVMIAITAGYGLIYICRLALGVVKKPLIDQGVFTPSELGLIGSALFWTYAIGKLTNGFFADHADIRKFMTASFLLSGLCCMLMGTVNLVWFAAFVWGLNGWFQSFGAPSGVVAMTSWFSNRERGRMYGIWSTAHSIGEGATFLIVGAVVTWMGWRAGFWVPGLIGVAVACFAWILLRDRPQTMGLPAVADWRNDHYTGPVRVEQSTVLKIQLSILKLPAIWILALSSALIYVTRYAINSWGVLYLQEARGLSLPTAASLLFVSTLAGIGGAIAYGFLSDKLFATRRPPANLLFALLELIGLLLFFFGPTSLPMMYLAMILFGLGMTGLVTSLGGLFAVDVAPKRAAGAVMGVIGVFSYIGAALQENVSGAMIEAHMTTVGDDKIYDFGPVIWVWIGASVLSMLLAASLWRTRLRD